MKKGQKKVSKDEEKVKKTVFRRDVEIDKVGKGQRFIVSSIVEGSPIAWDFVRALEHYAKVNNAKLVLLWMRGVYKGDHLNEKDLSYVSPYLASTYRFNSKLVAKDFMIHPAQKCPTTGLQPYAQSNDSIIVASTKQAMTVVARPVGRTPHTIHTTGTVSMPRYSKTRVGCIAEEDNTLGGLVIEVADSKQFFIRQIQWIDGYFVDLGVKYTKDNYGKIETSAMVLGDIHFGDEDPAAITLTQEQINFLKPKKVFLHDLASNNSINYHDAHDCIKNVTRAQEFDTLEKEWSYVKSALYDFKSAIPNNTSVYVVPSNHDDFIYKWLRDGEFIKDARNAKIGARLFLLSVEGKNPMAECLNVPGVIFLKKDTSMKVEGWECAQHGHIGNNGARGSIKSYAVSYDKAVIGHSHTPGINGHIWQVGTLSKFRLSYTKGPSSWLHTNCVIYKGGHSQMLTFVGDKWHVGTKH